MGKIIVACLLMIMTISTTWSSGLPLPAAVPGEILIKFKQDKTRFDHKNYHLAWKRDLKLSYGNFAIYRSNQKNISSLLSELKQDSAVAYAEPNFIYKIIRSHRFQVAKNFLQVVSENQYFDDPLLSRQWGLASGELVNGGADVTRAWEHFADTGRRVKIAVIDTGIDYQHPDLAANIWTNEQEAMGLPGVDDDGNGLVDDVHGYNFAGQNADPMDDLGHGTHCAGVIGAIHQNALGGRGVLRNVDLVAIKFIGVMGGTLEHAIAAIDYAVQLSVDIMSNSWGGGEYSQALEEAVQRAADAHIWFVAAAGNDYENIDQNPTYPAALGLENMLVVTAHDEQAIIPPFANDGVHTVDLSAPGVEIVSTTPNNNYESMTGTSMSAPFVAGALGMLLAQRPEGLGDFASVKARLAATTTKVKGMSRKVKMGGMLNVFNLMTNTQSAPAPVPEEHLWQQVILEKTIESDHPYANRSHHRQVITIPHAKYIRVKVERYQLEANYDFLVFSHPFEGEVDRLTGTGANYTSEYIEGDTVVIDFHADINNVDWGYIINSAEFIEESRAENTSAKVLAI